LQALKSSRSIFPHKPAQRRCPVAGFAVNYLGKAAVANFTKGENSMAEKKVQEQLFQAIRERLPASVAFIDAIADALHVSTDSAYRRIRGETPLVLEEVKVLCRQFGVSLDALLQTDSDAVMFHPVLVDSTQHTFDDYLSGLIQRLRHLSGLRQKEIIYLSKDIPIFHYFHSKPLFAFRYFFWMKTILQHPDFRDQTFSMAHVAPEIEKKAAEVSRLYKDIPSTRSGTAKASTACWGRLITTAKQATYRRPRCSPAVRRPARNH
jgi:hypothetical protein